VAQKTQKAQKKKNDQWQSIITILKKEDRPLIANHISQATKIQASLLDYHLKKMVAAGLLLTEERFGHTYYFLQPYFYMEEAETALMELILPWVKEIAKQTITRQIGIDVPVISNNLKYFFLVLLDSASKQL
jgi:DNA-binding transcriptional ArsR family regulator